MTRNKRRAHTSVSLCLECSNPLVTIQTHTHTHTQHMTAMNKQRQERISQEGDNKNDCDRTNTAQTDYTATKKHNDVNTAATYRFDHAVAEVRQNSRQIKFSNSLSRLGFGTIFMYAARYEQHIKNIKSQTQSDR